MDEVYDKFVENKAENVKKAIRAIAKIYQCDEKDVKLTKLSKGSTIFGFVVSIAKKWVA